MRLLEEIFTHKEEIRIAKAIVKMGRRKELVGKEHAVWELVSRSQEFGFPETVKPSAVRRHCKKVIAQLKTDQYLTYDETAESLIRTTGAGEYFLKMFMEL